MAFGDKSKKMADERKASSERGDGEKESFVSFYMPRGSGIRLFRWLPEIDKDRNPVLTPRISTAGTELREGNKKTGKILMGMIPTEETVFYFAWWEVMVGGSLVKRRLVVANTEQEFWTNALRKHIKENFEKGSEEYKVIKNVFAVNVFDMSPVKRNTKGQVFYQSESGNFDLMAYGPTGKIITDLDQLPDKSIKEAPLNEVRVLEASYGESGGKHLFAQFEDLMNDVEDPKSDEGAILRLPEFTMRLKGTGSGLKSVFSVKQTNDLKPLSREIAALPRYNLEQWAKAWPNEALQDLIDGRDYDEVIQEYKISLQPELEVLTEEALFEEE